MVEKTKTIFISDVISYREIAGNHDVTRFMF